MNDSSYKYILINNKELLVYDLVNGICIWKGSFGSSSIVKAIQLMDKCVLLLEFRNFNHKNLIKINQFGDILWEADCPDTHDFYLDCNLIDGQLEAKTWNGINVKLDFESGKYIIKNFLK